MSEAALQLTGVRKSFGRTEIVRGVDLAVHKGERHALIGPNGAGKSTLMMTIFGNPRARQGRILFDGQDITELPTHQIARLGVAQSALSSISAIAGGTNPRPHSRTPSSSTPSVGSARSAFTPPPALPL